MPFLNTILEVVFPSKCISCDKKGSYFCLKCLSLCPSAERESASWINPLFDYRHPPIKKAVWLIKYKGKKKIAHIFAEVMYGRIIEELADLRIMDNFKNPILIPIPLSKKRLRERGFNQAEIICKEIIKLDENKYLQMNTRSLYKIRDTEHQARIKNRADRLKNLSGTFEIKEVGAVKDKNIILIDDVTTTGATLAEAKTILKSAGAKKIIAFTIAH
jgi:competence protein ComFC